MPNLRLTEPEALDIAEYLSTLKAPAGFGNGELPKTDEKVLDSIALYFEMSTKTLFDAKAELAKMDLHAREVYTGKNLIAHYGCYACHAIPGFEDAKPIGTELTEEGSKAVHRLDFGFIHIPHTRHDWFRTKLHEPRIFDRDRARGWEEKLRMPNFRLSPRELDQVVTAVLGFQQLNAAPQVVKQLSPREAAVERGRRIVKNHNCQGCHVIEGFGGSYRSVVSDVSLAPPIIQGEGAKVQSDWLFGFLQAPKTGQIRPWLEAHMPTFGFTDAELNDLTQYFASLDRASVPVPRRRLRHQPRELGGGQEGVRAPEVRAVPPSVDRGLQSPRGRPREPGPESPDGLDAAPPRLDPRLDPAARRVDAGHADAHQLPQGRRRASLLAARPALRRAELRARPRGIRPPPRRRRPGQGVSLESGCRHPRARRLRLVDRRQRRNRPGRPDAAGGGACSGPVRSRPRARALPARRARLRVRLAEHARRRCRCSGPSTSPSSTAVWGSRRRL